MHAFYKTQKQQVLAKFKEVVLCSSKAQTLSESAVLNEKKNSLVILKHHLQFPFSMYKIETTTYFFARFTTCGLL